MGLSCHTPLTCGPLGAPPAPPEPELKAPTPAPPAPPEVAELSPCGVLGGGTPGVPDVWGEGTSKGGWLWSVRGGQRGPRRVGDVGAVGKQGKEALWSLESGTPCRRQCR